jgi:hypothetical protein
VLEEKLKNAKAFGNQLQSYGVFAGKISKSVTMHASRDKLICGISVAATIQGQTEHLRMKANIRQFSDGKITITFTDR